MYVKQDGEKLMKDFIEYAQNLLKKKCDIRKIQ